MPRQLHRLSAVKTDKTETPGMYADGGGLYLRVAKSGSKSWIFRFTLNGKAREMGLGSYTKVGLKKARSKAAKHREQLDAGIDPINQKMADDAAERLSIAKSTTFDECAAAYISANKSGWSNAKHIAQWENTLNTYASPVFGKLAVQDVDIDLVMQCLEPIWTAKTETATRVRGRIEAILDWAAVRGHRKGENPARWKGHLDKLLPPPSRVRRVQHHPALPYQDMPKFMVMLEIIEGVGARALEFTILTAARSGEVRNAIWSEFDLDAKLWTIPAARMKARKDHRVPLSSRAIAVLRLMEGIKSSDYVFPSPRYARPLSDMTLTAVLKRMNKKDITVHGFRSTFRDWCAELTNVPNIVAEAALAHAVENKVEAAYRRGDLFAKRVKLMENWAAYIHSQPAKIVPINKAKA